MDRKPYPARTGDAAVVPMRAQTVAARIMQMLGRLARRRQPSRNNAVAGLDGRMMRDIGMPEGMAESLRQERLLSHGRDPDPWRW